MRIYQNEQIGDIYRKRRGRLEDAIENFNITVKNARLSVLEQKKHGNVDYDFDSLLHYLAKFSLLLTETDDLLVSYRLLNNKDVLYRTFTISQSSKVKDSLEFYTMLLTILKQIEICSRQCCMLVILINIDSAFQELKEAFVSFADL